MCLSLLLVLILNNLEFSKRIWQKYRFHPRPFHVAVFSLHAPLENPSLSSKSFPCKVGKNNSVSNLGLSLEPATEIFQTIKLDSKDVLCMWFPESGLVPRDGTDISTLCLFSPGSISCECNNRELFPPKRWGYPPTPKASWKRLNSHSLHLNTYLKWPMSLSLESLSSN